MRIVVDYIQFKEGNQAYNHGALRQSVLKVPVHYTGPFANAPLSGITTGIIKRCTPPEHNLAACEVYENGNVNVFVYDVGSTVAAGVVRYREYPDE